jgi:hypothetical protein
MLKRAEPLSPSMIDLEIMHSYGPKQPVFPVLLPERIVKEPEYRVQRLVIEAQGPEGDNTIVCPRDHSSVPYGPIEWTWQGDKRKGYVFKADINGNNCEVCLMQFVPTNVSNELWMKLNEARLALGLISPEKARSMGII